jgi:hypothetical protein
VSSEGRQGEGFADGGLVTCIDGFPQDVELCSVGGNPGNDRSIGFMHALMIDGLVVSVTVKLCVEGKVFVGDRIVLVPFDMREGNGAGHGLDGLDYGVYQVPVRFESEVSEALGVRNGIRDPLEEGIIIAAELDLQGRVNPTEPE